jgi:hypothetical protein
MSTIAQLGFTKAERRLRGCGITDVVSTSTASGASGPTDRKKTDSEWL